MKLGLYSITYLGVWYRGDALTLEQLIARAKQFGYDGIEIDGKRPHGNPTDMPRERCAELRKKAEDAGIEIYAVAGNNDFSSPVPEHREAQLAYFRDLIRMTADLGAPVVRVFAGWSGVTRSADSCRYDIARRIWQTTHECFPAEQTWAWAVEGIREVARVAGDCGVTLALQNHAPIIETPADMLKMIRDVGSPHVKACLDAPLAAKQGDRSIRQPALATGSLQVLTHFGGEYDRGRTAEVEGWVRHPDGSLTREDYYLEFARAMREIGYQGYTGYELCHPLPIVNGKTVGVEFVDKNAQLAVEYMRGIIRQANA